MKYITSLATFVKGIGFGVLIGSYLGMWIDLSQWRFDVTLLSWIVIAVGGILDLWGRRGREGNGASP